MKLLQKFYEAAEESKTSKQMLQTIMRQFWSAHQRFFKQMCIATKVSLAVDLTNQYLVKDHSVVIALQTTGEAQATKELEKGDSNEFISTSK